MLKPALPIPNKGNLGEVGSKLFIAEHSCFSLVPTRIFHPEATVSIHSEFYLMVIQGTPKRYASFCTPPESVKIFSLFSANFIKSM